MVVSREGFCFCLGSLGKLGEGRVSVSVGERGDCGCGCGCGEYRSAASIERSMMWNFLFFFGCGKGSHDETYRKIFVK